MAIKIINKAKINESQINKDNLVNEIRVHWALESCASILRLIQLFEDGQSVYLVLEYQAKGSLMNSIMDSYKFKEQ